MKAAMHDVYGDASVVTIRDAAVPEPAAGEVLIRVHAAGLDRGVWHLLTGTPLMARLALGLRTVGKGSAARPSRGRSASSRPGPAMAAADDFPAAVFPHDAGVAGPLPPPFHRETKSPASAILRSRSGPAFLAGCRSVPPAGFVAMKAARLRSNRRSIP